MPGKFCCGDAGDDGPAAGGKAYMWCVTGDWCAYACVGFIYISLISIDITTTLFCIFPLFGGWHTNKGIAHLVFFQTTVFLVVWSHLTAAWSDPGLVAQDKSGTFAKLFEYELNEATKREAEGEFGAVKRLRRMYCKKCTTPKPKGSHHCSQCNRCVKKMDHHCPWINNCVGERNWKAFFLFLCYVTIGTGYAMVLYIMRTHRIVTSTKYEDRHSDLPRNVLIALVVWCIVSFILAGFFFAFVMCMFYDQYEAMTTGVPGVDALQYSGDIPKKYSCLQGLRVLAMANEPFSYRWFLPLIPKTLAYVAPKPPASPHPLTASIETTGVETDATGMQSAKQETVTDRRNLDAWAKKFDDLGVREPFLSEVKVSSEVVGNSEVIGSSEVMGSSDDVDPGSAGMSKQAPLPYQDIAKSDE